MNILGIDTTKSQAVIVANIDGIDYVEVTTPDEKHSETLLLHIEKLLDKAHVELKDIDVFGVIAGPGSFTGIRIGLATIKAFAFALNKKVLNINTFDAFSKYIKQGYMLLKCTKHSVYYGEIADSKLKSFGVVENSEIEKVIDTNSKLFVLDNEQIDGLNAYKNIESISNYSNIILDSFKQNVKSATFTESTLEPFYIELSQAERNLIG